MFLDIMGPEAQNKNSGSEKNCCDNMSLDRVNFCVTQFATRFTHVSRQYRTKNRKKKFKFRKNCFAIVVRDL